MQIDNKITPAVVSTDLAALRIILQYAAAVDVCFMKEVYKLKAPHFYDLIKAKESFIMP